MDIYILGGGSEGTQYARWLMLARERGKIDFRELVIVDKNENCKIKNSEVRIQNADWIDFLVHHIESSKADADDLIVPSHAAPHLLGMTFARLASSSGTKKNDLQMVDIPAPVGAPFEKRLEKGVVAVSMATWNCPANCPEPAKCPHIHAPRDWDLEIMLRDWAKKAGLDEFFVFPARHFAFAVSGIPSRTIIDSWRLLKKRLSTPGSYLIGVSTASACHGIISLFNVTVRP